MTTQSTHSRGTAHAAGPMPPGRSARAMAGRHSAAPGAELAAALRQGWGYDRCYDLFAPQLYRYCWSLLGPGGPDDEPDRAAAAVHETFLAAADRIGALGDDREFAAWLYALARTSARTRGFAPRSPYAQLATAEAERAVVQLSLRLPPSHRELLELYLRHGLPTSRIARILGLGSQTAAELCHTAVLRAAELISDHVLAPERISGHSADRGVRAVLTDLEPPGPPPALRERVLEDCASPLAAQERRAAGAALEPLGEDGFPLHRNRTPAGPAQPCGAIAEAEVADAAGDCEQAVLPADRVTTRDVPASRDPEPVAHAYAGSEPTGAGRWLPTPVAATLAAVAVVACLWAGMAALRPINDDTVDSGAPAPPASTSTEESAGASSAKTGEENSTQTQPVRPRPLDDATLAPSSSAQTDEQPSQEGSQAPDDPGADPAEPTADADAPGGQGAQEDGGEHQDGGQGADDESGGEDSGGGAGSGSGDGSDDGSADDGKGPVSELLGGLFGLLEPRG